MSKKQYRVAYELFITGEIDVMADNAEEAVDELKHIDLDDLVEQGERYEVYTLGEPEEENTHKYH